MRVLLVDNNTLFRQGLIKVLATQPDIEVVGEAGDGWEAVVEARRLSPDLVILEVGLPRRNGLDHVTKIRQESPTTRLLVLTSSDDEGVLLQALNRGAHGYLLKSSTPEQLFLAIRSVMRGETAISPLVGGKTLRELILREQERATGQGQLTPREEEVLALLGTGISYKDISVQLSLSVSTVGHHVHNILRKLNLRNRVQAATFARDQAHLNHDSEAER